MSLFLKNHFLIATPQLHQSYFERAVILLTEHDAKGAFGIVLNKPADITTDEIFSQLKLEYLASKPLRTTLGGPVSPDRGLVLHNQPQNDWKDSLKFTDTIGVTTSTDVLAALAADTGPEQALFAFGYSGWSAGQLDQEILDNSWLTFPNQGVDIFTTPPAKLLDTITTHNGIPYNSLVGGAGHA